MSFVEFLSIQDNRLVCLSVPVLIWWGQTSRRIKLSMLEGWCLTNLEWISQELSLKLSLAVLVRRRLSHILRETVMLHRSLLVGRCLSHRLIFLLR
jgi:hypothetical protein